jgi:hypothetical protein
VSKARTSAREYGMQCNVVHIRISDLNRIDYRILTEKSTCELSTQCALWPWEIACQLRLTIRKERIYLCRTNQTKPRFRLGFQS